MSANTTAGIYVGRFYGRDIFANPETAELIRHLQQELEDQHRRHARDLEALGFWVERAVDVSPAHR